MAKVPIKTRLPFEVSAFATAIVLFPLVSQPFAASQGRAGLAAAFHAAKPGRYEDCGETIMAIVATHRGTKTCCIRALIIRCTVEESYETLVLVSSRVSASMVRNDEELRQALTQLESRYFRVDQHSVWAQKTLLGGGAPASQHNLFAVPPRGVVVLKVTLSLEYNIDEALLKPTSLQTISWCAAHLYS